MLHIKIIYWHFYHFNLRFLLTGNSAEKVQSSSTSIVKDGVAPVRVLDCSWGLVIFFVNFRRIRYSDLWVLRGLQNDVTLSGSDRKLLIVRRGENSGTNEHFHKQPLGMLKDKTDGGVIFEGRMCKVRYRTSSFISAFRQAPVPQFLELEKKLAWGMESSSFFPLKWETSGLL